MRTIAFVGLLLNTVGTALVWRFCLPQDVNRKGNDFLILQGKNETEKKKAKRFDCASNFGMGLILLGFILQAIAIYYI